MTFRVLLEQEGDVVHTYVEANDLDEAIWKAVQNYEGYKPIKAELMEGDIIK